MSENSGVQQWEALVKKQLKTEAIYEVLNRENLEDITVRPFYDPVAGAELLPRWAESTHLVAPYHENLTEQAFAFLVNENVENLSEKVIFFNDKNVASEISLSPENTYFSLVDVFSDDSSGAIDKELAKLLLSKNFTKNLCVDVSLHQNAGASIIQQLAVALSKTRELAEVFGAEVFSKITCRIAVGGNYFFEIAKIRALKLLVAELAQEYGREETPFIFAETSLRNKTTLDPENNLVRSSLEIAAAMTAGADAVFSHDYRLQGSQSVAADTAFKQTVVLAYESILNVFEDAGAGSGCIEDFTQQFAEKAWEFFLNIEDRGGYCAAMQTGFLQKEIYAHAVAEQNWVSEGRIKLTGVNLYPKLPAKKEAAEMYDASRIQPVRWAEMFE